VLTARHRCHTSSGRSDVVGCGQKVAERVKKSTSIPEMNKKDELPMKLLNDPKILTTSRSH
jgi:hypothetical protein